MRSPTKSVGVIVAFASKTLSTALQPIGTIVNATSPSRNGPTNTQNARPLPRMCVGRRRAGGLAAVRAPMAEAPDGSGAACGAAGEAVVTGSVWPVPRSRRGGTVVTRALPPPMGWNSWDCYGTTVTEDEVLANARFLAERMLGSGWDTVVVDIDWYDPDSRAGGYNQDARVVLDEHGLTMPAPNRFPSAAGGAGFAPLAEEIHALGLTFGVHVMRGIPRVAVHRDLPVAGTPFTAGQIAVRDDVCEWNPDNYGLDHSHPGAQAYYDAQVAQFARWGVDFVKADDMLGPYHADDIAAYATAIARSGRDITLSLSPGRAMALTRLDHLRQHANTWRISDDLWDRWSDVYDQFGRLARWAPTQRPGSFADADMLPVGRIGIRAERGTDRVSGLSRDEQRTMLSLWCLARSPLMVGCDLPTSPPETIDLLTNDAVLDVLRSGTDGREVLREGDLVLWTARHVTGDDRWVGVFWTGDEPGSVRVAAGSADLAPDAAGVDLWSGGNVAAVDGELALDVPAHGVRLLRFSGPA